MVIDDAIKIVMYVGWGTSSFLAIAGTWIWRFTVDDPNNPNRRRLTPQGRRMRWALLVSLACGTVGAIYSEISARESAAKLKQESADAIRDRQDAQTKLARVEVSLREASQDREDAQSELASVKALLSDARRSIEESNSEMTLLLTSPHHITRKIHVDIPIVLPDFKNIRVFKQDIRDIFFPGWRSGEFGVVLGELLLSAESGHFNLSVWFNGDPWEPIPFWERDQVLKLRTILLRGENAGGNAVDRRVWNLLSETAQKDVRQYGIDVDKEFEQSDRIRDEMTAMLNRTDLFDDATSQDVPSYLKGVQELDLQSLPIQELRALNSRLFAHRFGRQLFRRDIEEPASPIFGGAEGGRNPFQEGLRPEHGISSFGARLVSFGKPAKQHFRMTVQFKGEHAASDWNSDLRSGRSILTFKCQLQDQKMLGRVEQRWTKIFGAGSALLRVPVNESGSVAMLYRAVPSSPEIVRNLLGKRFLRVVWRIQGEPSVVPVHRDNR